MQNLPIALHHFDHILTSPNLSKSIIQKNLQTCLYNDALFILKNVIRTGKPKRT